MELDKTVVALKEWINEQSEIPETPDADLKLFAHVANEDLETAKRLIFNYYSHRLNGYEALFKDRDIDNDSLTNIRNVFETFICPKPTPEGCKILISHALTSDTKNYDMIAQMKYFVMTLEASLIDEDLGPGHVVIFDISTLTTGHILKFSPSGIKKTSNYLQEGIPLKIQNVYLVNASPVVDIMMKTAKPFINMDLLKRTHIYRSGDMEKLYEHVPKSCLPEEYGGYLGPSSAINEENTAKLRKLKEKFTQEEDILKTMKEKGNS
ncbi:alpha-tocopherol transfer protein-like [Macrosteles quadrilineatus]|uniref:alpha-tocopherol transfer protein-like n=1 Tax=Macrosteles quadrilineatus TaxID=74068 RepID=UPI0023E104FC|nr:alpha-tocopherol transfer protein-like [Macrosteles quadrilineatus]